MTGIIEGVEKLINFYNRASKDLSKPPEFRVFAQEGVEYLRKADLYEINEDIANYAVTVKKETFGKQPFENIRLPVDARPPSKICFFYIPHFGNGYLTTLHEVDEFPDDIGIKVNHPSVLIVRMSTEHMPLLGGGYAVSNQEQDNKVFFSTDVQNEHLANAIVTVGMLVSIINQPRFVIRGEAGTRQLRRQMNRGHGIATNAWHKIQWNLNEPVVEKDKGERGGWHLPLHYTRGHWRRGQSHWDDIVIRKDGLPYKWIEGFWSGHPAYGFKKSYHAPNLGGS